MNKLKLFGRPDSSEVYPLRDFLIRSVIDFEWIDIKEGSTDFTAIEFQNGELIISPTIEEIARRLGWINKPKYDEYDVSIYGAGPAGLSAAVYAASEGLRTILIEKEAIGGQAGTSSLIENYLGFPGGISGASLAERAREQALKFGVEILLLKEGIKGSFYNNRITVELANGGKMVAKSNICATGIEYAKLNLLDEEKFFHKGVYYGAGASEACFCKGKDIFIIGGGNSAGQAACHFSTFARKVYMVIRKGNLSFTLSDYLVKRVKNIKNVEILYYSEVIALEGDDHLSRIKIYNTQENKETWYTTSKLFICIGGNPNTEWTKGTAILKDQNGYLITGSDLIGIKGFSDSWKPDRLPYHLETSVPGSFAAGDVRFNAVKRVASAVGEGAMAVTLVHKYLTEL